MFDDASGYTRRALLHQAARYLDAAGIPDSRRNAEWMLEDIIPCSRAMLYARSHEWVMPEQVGALSEMITRRVRREPLQYILGYTDFYGLRLEVTPDVLIPRPETEQVVEAALALLDATSPPKVLDVGTGSGCIALAVKHARPDAYVVAGDVSEAALRVAARNAAVHGLKVTFTHADVRSAGFAALLGGDFDLLISNPPYIADEEAVRLEPEVRDYEPPGALFAGEEPLYFYHRIARHAVSMLKEGGWLVFETHADRGVAVRDALARAGFAAPQLKHDLAGLPRIVWARRPERAHS